MQGSMFARRLSKYDGRMIAFFKLADGYTITFNFRFAFWVKFDGCAKQHGWFGQLGPMPTLAMPKWVLVKPLIGKAKTYKVTIPPLEWGEEQTAHILTAKRSLIWPKRNAPMLQRSFELVTPFPSFNANLILFVAPTVPTLPAKQPSLPNSIFGPYDRKPYKNQR